MKAGVIGVGHLGRHHARIYRELEKTELIGIFDTEIDRSKEIATRNQCNYYKTVDELIANAEIINIASPTTTHYEYAKKCLLAGKHIFIEKPICSEIWQAEEIVKLATDNKLKVQVGHIERFNPAIIALTNILIDPLFIEANRIAPFTPRGSDVPVVLDLMIHDIDIILSLVNSPVKSIRAIGVPILTKDIDIANARLEFENGALANITSSRISLKQERKIRFFQKDMYISLNYQDKSVKLVRKNPKTDSLMKEIMTKKREPNIFELFHIENLKIKEIEPLKAELESFADAVLKNKRPIVDAKDGFEALQVAFMIMDDIEKTRKDIL